jgi:hypothetical protein
MQTTLRRRIRDRSAAPGDTVQERASQTDAAEGDAADAAGKGAAEKGAAGKVAGAREARARRREVRPDEALPDGVGGTITGGPMQPINLIEILRLGGRGASGSGAVSGAAQGALSGALSGIASGAGAGAGGGRDRGIALSDGSRIIFASVEQATVLDERFLVDSES